MSTREEELLDDNFQLLFEDSFTLNSSSIPASRPSELAPPSVSEPMDSVAPPRPASTPSPFESALCRFYAVYNPENVPRAASIAAKFTEDRLKLWEQLSIKYTLSYRASCKLFTEISAPLFPEASGSSSDWFALLFSETSEGDLDLILEKKREFYESMRKELEGRKSLLSFEAIERDVNRTHQEIGFFHSESTKKALMHMLQLVTVLNGMEYVQGMHEIAGVIYFELKDEAKAFWVLNEVLGQMKDLYNAEVDGDVEVGIYGLIDEIGNTLKFHANNKLHNHLHNLGFPLETVVLRYVTTLMATELNIPDTVRVWGFLLHAVKAGKLREMNKALAVGYLMLMAENLMECEDLEAVMAVASKFGKSVNFNPDVLIRNVAACYAFEVKLKNKYTIPQSPGVMAVLGGAVEGVLNKMGELLEQLNDEDATSAKATN